MNIPTELFVYGPYVVCGLVALFVVYKIVKPIIVCISSLRTQPWMGVVLCAGGTPIAAFYLEGIYGSYGLASAWISGIMLAIYLIIFQVTIWERKGMLKEK